MDVKLYTVKEIFPTIQGEGFWSGRAATFVRFAGCNLWSGREEDRAKAACQFCDTDFVGGRRYTLEQLVAEVLDYPQRFIVFTGGEPGLQLDAELVRVLQRRGFYCAVETNGTVPLPLSLDWVCVSPKAGTQIVTTQADELKLVYPQENLPPWEARLRITAKHMWLSPMDGPDWKANVQRAVEFVAMDGRWRLNIQAHKMWGIR
jgi:7-carboxy-7-deazaguanine synthase